MKDDTISRAAALKACRNPEYGENAYAYGDDIEKRLMALPSAQPSATDICVGGNLIDRQAAIIQLSHNKTGDDDCDVIVQKDIETIKLLPSAQPSVSKTETVDDCISRAAAIDTVRKAKDKSEAHRMLIQMPSAQPECEDTISRSHFDERVRLAGGISEEELTDDFKDGVLTVLEMLRTEPPVTPKQPGWIPVTEKCPEIGQIVLCSLKTRHYYGRIHVCRYRAADKYYDHPYFDWDHNGFPDVVAWMPLPTPAKIEG